jgi:hypothetical protein
METQRLSDDQRRILAFFIDHPPDDKLGMIAAAEYLRVIVEYLTYSLKDGEEWNRRDSELIIKMSEVLIKKTDALVDIPRFWERVQEQLSNIHPNLKAR